MRPTVHLLSIGINTYQSENILNLRQCRNDVYKFEQTLIGLNLVQEQNCKSLLDKEATRANIIASFRTHFHKMKDGDIAVLYFSGHGSSERTSPAFITANVEHKLGRNENLVPYDSDAPGIYDIADKELRWLVGELQTKKRHTSFVAIFDCCHSGSALKYDEVRMKAHLGLRGPRPLDSYLEGEYQELLDRGEPLSLPNIDYILLSACRPHEMAWEDGHGGVFTAALTNFLKKKNGRITYSELSSLSTLEVKAAMHYQQHPNLEFSESADPYRYFLKNEKDKTPFLPILKKIDAQWHTLLGTIHGLEGIMDGNRKIPIYKDGNYSKAIGYAEVDTVYLEKTIIRPTWHSIPPDDSEILCVGLHPSRLPINIRQLHKESKFNDCINQFCNSEDFNNQFSQSDQGDYAIEIEEDELTIYKEDGKESTLIIGTKDAAKHTLNWLNFQWQMITKWENILNLYPSTMSKLTYADISLKFKYKYRSEEMIDHCYETSYDFVQHISVPLTEEKNTIYYTLEVEHKYHNSQGLYFYLLHLDRKYSIKQKHEDHSKPLMRNLPKILYNSEQNSTALGVTDPDVKPVEDYFVLIASSTPLANASYFNQKGFGNQFGKTLKNTQSEITRSTGQKEVVQPQQWCIKRLVVRLM